MNRILIGTLALVAVIALAVVSAAGGAPAKKGKPSLSATPVFKLNLKPSQEVPPIKGLKAKASGHVTFDLTRDSSGAITAGEVVFYFNYSFPASVTISGLHIHQGAKGANGDIVVDSGVTSFTDADGAGNITRLVTSGFTLTTLQAILDNPRNYYVNLHTTTPPHPGGALRAQMHNPKKG
jgi:CHRD domain